MKYTLTSRKLSIDDRTRSFIDEKLSKIEKYSNKLTNIHVIINKEKFNFPVEILINGKYFNIKGMGLTNDIKASFEIALSKVLKQLQKRKDKIKQHKNSEQVIINEPEILIPEEGTENINIVETKEIDIMEMDINEALSRIQEKLLNFFVFINRNDKKFSIIYKNPDNSYSLMKIK